MILKFKKGTQLYLKEQIMSDSDPTIIPAPGQKLEEDFECEKPQKDYQTTIAGTQEIPVSAETTVKYNDIYYLKCGDASNFNTNTAKEVASNTLNKIMDFFYEEITPTHEETDKEGNTVIVEDEPVRQINWFKIGACSTSITLLIIGAIIMLIRKHK